MNEPDTLPAVLEKHQGIYVGIDVIATAFGVKIRRAYAIATQNRWRQRPGHYPRQYAFADVIATYNARQKGTT